MSAYDNDPRVTDMGGSIYRVLPTPQGPIMAVAPGLLGGFVGGKLGDEWTRTGFDTLDEAIRSLIGEPR